MFEYMDAFRKDEGIDFQEIVCKGVGSVDLCDALEFVAVLALCWLDNQEVRFCFIEQLVDRV